MFKVSALLVDGHLASQLGLSSVCVPLAQQNPRPKYRIKRPLIFMNMLKSFENCNATLHFQANRNLYTKYTQQPLKHVVSTRQRKQ